MQARSPERDVSGGASRGASLFGGIDIDSAAGAAPQSEDLTLSEDLEASSRQENLSPVLSLVDRILIEALTSSASDIPEERITGTSHQAVSNPAEMVNR